MKKLFAILAVTAVMTSCNEAETKVDATADSLKAVATADSLAAVQALADTSKKVIDSTIKVIDSTVKVIDSTKK